MDQVEDFLSGNSIQTNIAFAVVFWSILLLVLRRLFTAASELLCSNLIPVENAFLPAQTPHPNPGGSAVPFEIPLTDATDQQIASFMTFRRRLSWNRSQDGLEGVACEAARYKGELFDERVFKWIDDHFRLKLPNLKYPYVATHWNGWSSFWLETGPRVQNMSISSFVLTIEHVVNGLVTPLLFLATERAVYFDLSMYGEVGYQLISCFWIIVSYVYKKDLTVEQMHKSIWHLLFLHHFSTIGLCLLCLILGDDGPRVLASHTMVSMLGVTSTLHYVAQVLDFSPFSQANTPYFRLANHVFATAAQIWFRCISWTWILYNAVTHSFQEYSTSIASGITMSLLLFTVFNVEFVSFHIKATKGCWAKIKETQNKSKVQ